MAGDNRFLAALAVSCTLSMISFPCNATPTLTSDYEPITAINTVEKGGIKIFYTFLGNDGMSFFEALDFCFGKQMTPAIITSAEEDAILSSFLTSLNGSAVYNNRPFWLSLNDIENEGTFNWIGDSNNSQYRNWAPSSPQANDTAENCVSAQQLSIEDSSQNFGWINLPCSTKWRPLCQQKLGWK